MMTLRAGKRVCVAHPHKWIRIRLLRLVYLLEYLNNAFNVYGYFSVGVGVGVCVGIDGGYLCETGSTLSICAIPF